MMRSFWMLAATILIQACKPEIADTYGSRGTKGPSSAKHNYSRIDKSALIVFKKLPDEFSSDDNPVTEAKITLGRHLYYEKRLSKNHDISCNSCHDLKNFGVDGKPVSPGHRGQLGGRNSPTVYNAGLHLAQFWDGRAATLEEQAKGPILNPVEMAMKNEQAVVDTLKSIPGYQKLFKDAFPAAEVPLTYDNMANAIGAFERRLATPSRFDAFLSGKESALSDVEVEGLKTFVALGCTQCHNGVALGGNSFQKVGQVVPWTEDDDQGRFDVTNNPIDKQMFKVPSLRNIAKTAPYFHDGKTATLDDAIRKMAWHQLGKKLEQKNVTRLIAFLNALTGEIPTEYIKEPATLAGGPKTPKPDPT